MDYRRIPPEHKQGFPYPRNYELLALLADRPEMLRVYLLGERMAREMGLAAACRDSRIRPKVTTPK